MIRILFCINATCSLFVHGNTPFCVYVYLTACLFFHSIYLSFFVRSFCLSDYLSVSVSVNFCMSIRDYVRLSMYLTDRLSVYLSV